MAQSDKILNKEVFDELLFVKQARDAKELDLVLKDLEASFKAISKESKKILTDKGGDSVKSIKEKTKAIEDNKAAYAGLNAVKKAQNELEKDKLKTEEKSEKQAKAKLQLTDKEIKQAEVRRRLEAERLKVLKAFAVLESDKLGLEKKLIASNELLRIRRDRLTGSEKNYAIVLKEINSKIDKNNALINQNADQLKQQKINVGNYTRSIHSAINETGIFNSTLGNLIIALRGVIVAQDATATGVRRLSNVLKTSGILLLISAIAGLTAIFKANQGVIDAFSNGVAEFKDEMVGLVNAFREMLGLDPIETNYRAANAALIALRETTREYERELAKLTDTFRDEMKVVDDSTVNIATRKQALIDAQKAETDIANLKVKQAQAEFDILDKQKFLNGRDEEDKQRLLEAELKLFNAKEDLNDLTVDQARKNRQILGEQLGQELDLLIGKKTSATAQVTILKKLASDEKAQIADRIANNKLLNSELDQDFAAQLEVFNKFSSQINGITIDRATANKLLAAQSKEDLADLIKGLKLNVQQEQELAKIITKTQNAKVDSAEIAAKITQDEIDLNNRLLEIKRQIAEIEANDKLNDLEIEKNLASQKTAKQEQEFLSGNIFNKKKLDQVKEARENERSIEDDILQQRIKDLEREKKDNDKRTLEKGLQKQEELDELEKLQRKFDIDMANLEAENTAKTNARKEADSKWNIDLKNKEAQILSQNAATLTNSLGEELDKQSQRQQDAYDLDLAKRQESIDIQKDLAAQGLDNQLAFEQSQQAKTELQRKEALEKAQKDKENLQLIEAYFNAYNNRMSKEGANPTQAASQALGDVLLAKGIARGLQYAQEGNEDVRPLAGGVGIKGKDTIPFMLEEHEAVLTAKANIKHKGVAKALNNDTFEDLYLPKTDLGKVALKAEQTSMERAYKSFFIQENKEVVSLLKKIEAKPTQMIDVDKLGNLIETVHKNGLKTVTKYVNNNRIG